MFHLIALYHVKHLSTQLSKEKEKKKQKSFGGKKNWKPTSLPDRHVTWKNA